MAAADQARFAPTRVAGASITAGALADGVGAPLLRTYADLRREVEATEPNPSVVMVVVPQGWERTAQARIMAALAEPNRLGEPVP